MESRREINLPPPTGVEIATAVKLVRVLLKTVLSLLGVATFLVLEFGTRVADSFGGTPQQVAFALVMLCFIPLLVIYFPLSLWATAWVKRRLQRRGR
ncbi:MAG: hypothetical protein GYA21_18125 [Myxococcales bacterium]|nr:hypothetical protein [Myxococcales bacterium]